MQQPPTLAERFEDFHRRNPRVFALLIELAAEYVRKTGNDRVGFDLLYGTARWKWEIEMAQVIAHDEAGSYLLNNSYRSFYARLLMHEQESMAGLFELRMSADADVWAANFNGPVSPGFKKKALELAA